MRIDGYPNDKEMLKRVATTFGLPLWKGPVVEIQESLQKEGVPKIKSGEVPWEWMLRVTEYANNRSRTRSASTASNLRTRDMMADEEEASDAGQNQEEQNEDEDNLMTAEGDNINNGRALEAKSTAVTPSFPIIHPPGLRDSDGDSDASVMETSTPSTKRPGKRGRPASSTSPSGKERESNSSDKHIAKMMAMMGQMQNQISALSRKEPSIQVPVLAKEVKEGEGKVPSQQNATASGQGAQASNNSGTIIHNNEFKITLPSVKLDPLLSHVAPATTLDAQLGFFVPLYKFIRSLEHFNAAGLIREQQSPSKEGVALTSNGSQFTSWASVLEAFVMMMVFACEDRPSRLADYANFLTQVTARACENAWPVMLYYVEKVRSNALPARPQVPHSAGSNAEAEAIAATQEKRELHKLSHEINELDLVAIYQRIMQRPQEVAARLHIQLDALKAAMPELRATPLATPKAASPYGSQPGGSASGSNLAGSARDRISSEVAQWCTSRKVCMKFQLGQCPRDSTTCRFTHIMYPGSEVSGSPLGGRPDFIKKDKEISAETDSNADRGRRS